MAALLDVLLNWARFVLGPETMVQAPVPALGLFAARVTAGELTHTV